MPTGERLSPKYTDLPKTVGAQPRPYWFGGSISIFQTMRAKRLSFRLLLACLWLISGPSFASSLAPNPQDAAARLAAANSAFQKMDYEGALALLQPAMPSLQRNGRAWRLTGLANLRLYKSTEAIKAYRQALALDPMDAQAQFYLGVTYAQQQQIPDALRWLRRAKATHRFDMTQLTVETDLTALRSDYRFGALMPTPADFDHPFVEAVNIIHEWDGEEAEDQFGWIARVIGDVDGDGYNDFVTSAPTHGRDGTNAGKVYVYSGHSGALLWSVDGSPGDQVGSGLEAAGDVDGDGVPDVIASAPEHDIAYVYSGRDGHTLHTLRGEATGDRYGEHVAGVGDIDGDGFADFIIEAPANNAGGKGAGRAYVYSGKDGHRLLTLTGELAGDSFGSTVAGYADATHRFLVVGAPGAGPRRSGRVYVYAGLSSEPAFVIDGDPTAVALGYMFASVLGDVDGDGVPDIFASDWSDANRGPGTGKTYVYSGRTGQRLFTFTGQTAGEGFGTTHSVAGDVNGDGHADLIIGAWQYSESAQGAGRAYLYDGRSGRLLKTYTSRIPGETFGFDAVGLGELDSKGQVELLITSGWSGVHGHHSGRVFLISSGITRQAAPF